MRALDQVHVVLRQQCHEGLHELFVARGAGNHETGLQPAIDILDVSPSLEGKIVMIMGRPLGLGM